MQLTLKVIGERVKAGTYNYARPENEEYVVADASITGTNTFIAASLRSLADSIDPPAKPEFASEFARGGIVR